MRSDKPSEPQEGAKAVRMGLPEQQPIIGDAEISPQNQDVLLQIASLIRLAEGFRLGFIKCNQPIQCRQNADRLKEMLAGEKAIISIELHEPIASLRRAVLQALEPDRLDRSGNSAIMIFGFEHSVPSNGPAPALDELNQSREIFPKYFSCPVLIWLPDYALTRLAREAPDFWGWRSGVFEFFPELRLMTTLVNDFLHDNIDNMSLSAKRERAAALEGLIFDYKEFGIDAGVSLAFAGVLNQLGSIKYQLGEYSEAKRLYENSLKRSQELQDRKETIVALGQLGNLAYQMGDLNSANKYYSERLKLSRELGDSHSVSDSLGKLGMLAEYMGSLTEARRLFQDSLTISKEHQDKNGISKAIHHLGNLAHLVGDLGEANRLYNISLNISEELGDKRGRAIALHQLGILAQEAGDLSKADRLYRESLNSYKSIGDKKGISQSYHQLGNLAYLTGDLDNARHLYQESLKIFQELGYRDGISDSLGQLGILAYTSGALDEARRLILESLQISKELGNRNAIAIGLKNLSLLDECEGNFDEALELITEATSILLELNSPIAAQAKADRQRLENKVKKSNDKK
ncbi:MAG TPA: tetratricopeptide repeat protein [Methanothrix sp.]|nr:tetratricopeptide repeat protein [Methanothrix sp.]